MASIKYTNNAKTTLAANLSNSATSATVVNGNLFPSLSSGEHFYCTFDDGSNIEIVKVTARSTHVLTIVRAQDNTSARAFTSGHKAELRITAVVLEEVSSSTSSWNTDIFAGDGSDATFTLTQAATDEKYLQVYIDGAFQAHNTYSVSGTTLTFATAPANSRVITVYHIEPVALGTATGATITANNSTDETVFPTFVDGATGTQGLETDTGFTYNPSSGLLTIAGELDAGSLDISGNADIDGTLEADAITVNGVTLAETIADTVGAMVSSNTETGIAVTYADSDNTLDFVLPAAATITTSLGVGGGSTNGVLISQGAIKIKNGGAKSYIDLYCESSNAHYTRIEAAAHGAYSGNVTATLPVATGTLALTSDIHTTEELQDIIGAMFASNTETGITVTYQDGDGTVDLVVGTLNQNTTGSAATLTTARTIGGTSFDGSANIAVALAAEATILATARTIGGTSFDGSANIAVALAAEATILATARTIGGVSFDGSANINLPGVNSAGNQNVDAALVDGENFKINGGQGNDGQVLTSTGSGVAWEDAAGGGPTSKTFGTGSIMVGDNATGTINAANYNTGLGVDIFTALTTADFCTAVGFNALKVVTTGDANTCIGEGAGQKINVGYYNTFVGKDAGENVTTADEIVGVGANALQACTGSFNTAVGTDAAKTLTTGTSNVAVGYSALAHQAVTGANNVAVGNAAAKNITSGHSNVAIGSVALEENTTGHTNTAVGLNALGSNTTALYNVALGTNAGNAITTGNGNTAIGANTMNSGTTAANNTVVGTHAATSMTSALGNTIIGTVSAIALTTGQYNNTLGYASGYAITTGDHNECIGASAGLAITTGDNNIAIGKNALNAVTTTSNQIAIGYEALRNQNSNAHNTAVGHQAGKAITGGASNDLFGFQAGDSITTGDTNICIGGFSMDSGAAQTGSGNTHVGHDGMKVCTSGSNNVSMGLGATIALTTGSSNTIVGKSAGIALTTGSNNVHMGISAGGGQTTGSDNVSIGRVAGYNINTGGNNVCIGYEAGNDGSPSGNILGNSNRIVLGNDSSSHAHIQIDWTVASDKRDKTDVTPLDVGLSFINKLEPVTYKWDKRSRYQEGETPDGTHKESWTDVGFLAQDVEKIEAEFGHKIEDETNLTTHMHDDKNSYGLTYAKFVPMLVKALQEADDKIDALTTRLEALEG